MLKKIRNMVHLLWFEFLGSKPWLGRTGKSILVYPHWTQRTYHCSFNCYCNNPWSN